MNELRIFKNKAFGQVRTLTFNNEPYFVGKDIADALQYSESHKAITRHVDEDDRTKHPITDNLGRSQDTWIINESGLYSLILSSKLQSAKKFKRWVTSEVLPTIRKHGMYATDELINNPDLLIEVATALKEERERTKFLASQVDEQQRIIERQSPKVTYYDLVLQCTDLLSATEIAKDYGKSAQWLNNYLREKRIQFRQSGRWFLYAKYAELGYAQSKTHPYTDSIGNPQTKTHLYWTQKGRYFIYETLKADGIVPIIEREEQEDKP